MLSIVKKILPEKLKNRVKNDLRVPSLSWSLINLKKMGVYPKNVLDIGAYHGNWTNEFLSFFPKSQILMIEGQSNLMFNLQRMSLKNQNIKCYEALISSTDGEEVLFVENETDSHITKIKSENSIVKITETIDSIIIKAGFSQPDFIKIDIQGHELEALKGASNALKKCELCLLEVTVMNVGRNEPLILEVLNFMNQRDYQLYDISQLIRRPFDSALFQMDVLFVKKSSKLIQEKVW